MTLARWIRITLTGLVLLALTAPVVAQDGDADLLARISSEVGDQGTLIWHYPDGWVAQDFSDGELLMASSQALLERVASGSFGILSAGEAFAGVQRLRVDQYTGWGLTVDASPGEVIAGLITTADARDELFLGDVEEFDVHGVPAGLATGRINVEGQYYAIIVTTITLNGQIITAHLLAPKDEVLDHLDTARAMISQAEFRTPHTLTQSIRGTIPDAGTLTLYFPEGWLAEPDADGLIFFGSSPVTLQRGLADDVYQMDRGEVAGIVTVLPELSLSYMDLGKDASPVDVIIAITGDIRFGGDIISRSIGDPESFDADGRAAAIATGTVQVEQGVAGTILTVLKLDGAFGILIFALHQDEVPAYVDLAQAMTAALEFTSERAKAINLAQSLTAEIGGVGEYSVGYPEGWVGQTGSAGLITVASSASALEKATNEGTIAFQEGEVAAAVIIIPPMLYPTLDLGADPQPDEAIAVLAQLVVDDGEDTEVNTLNDPESFTLAGRAAAIATGTTSDGGVTNGTIFATISLDGGLGFIIFVTHLDEVTGYTDLARAMVGSLTLIPEGVEEIDLPQSVSAYVEGAGEYTLYYPEDWVGVADAEMLMVANSRATLDKALGGGEVTLESGEIAATALALPEYVFSFFGIEEGGSMADAIAGFATNITSDEGTTADFDDPEPFDANGKSAALMAGTVTENATIYDAILVAVEIEGGIGIIMVISHVDEADQYKPIIRAMAGAFAFTPAQ